MALIRCALRTQAAWDAMSPSDQAAYTAHFTSLADWQTARARDLVSAGDIEQLEVFDDWVSGYWEGSVFAFNGTWVTDSSNYIHICAAPGHEARGRKTAGARFIRPDSGTTWSAVFDPSPSKSLVIHWSDLSIINYEPNGIIANFPDANSVYKRCLLNGIYATLQYPKSHKLYSCIIEGGEYGVIDADWNNTANEYENCVFVATDTNAVAISGGVSGSQRAQNCFFGNFVTDTSILLSSSSSNNATTKSTADDASITVLSVDTSASFIDYANGDYHIIPGSIIDGAGVNLYDGTGTQLDIDGDLWPATGAWNIGADTQSVNVGFVLDVGNYAYSGYDLYTQLQSQFVIENGLLEINGYDLQISKIGIFIIDWSEYSFIGNDILITSNTIFPIDAGSNTIFGNDILFSSSYNFQIDGGIYQASGNDLYFVDSTQISLDAGNISVNGKDISFLQDNIFALDIGINTISGNDILFLSEYNTKIDYISYIQNGSELLFKSEEKSVIDFGSYSIYGSDLSFIRHSNFYIDHSAYLANGNDLQINTNSIFMIESSRYNVIGHEINKKKYNISNVIYSVYADRKISSVKTDTIIYANGRL